MRAERVALITAGRTAPNRAVRFGGDLSLDERGRRSVAALTPIPHGENVIGGPERATRETSAIVGPACRVDYGLRTLDVGTWAGRSPQDIESGELAQWFTDPHACPHGGETIAEFVSRIHCWRASLDATAGPLWVVAAMPVVQAMLCGESASYFAVEVAPASVYQLGDAAAIEGRLPP